MVVGYWVTPVLFSELPQKQAGAIAADLFNGVALLTLTVLVLLSVVVRYQNGSMKSSGTWVAATLIMAVLVGLVAPWMAEIKSAYP